VATAWDVMLLLVVLVAGACSSLSPGSGEPTLLRPPCSNAVARVQQYKRSPHETLTVQDVLNRAVVLARSAGQSLDTGAWEATATANGCRVVLRYRERGEDRTAEWQFTPSTGVVHPLNEGAHRFTPP
jgi:hypothetical protein